MATLKRVEGNLYVLNPDGNTPIVSIQRPPKHSSKQIAQKLFEKGMVAEDTADAEIALDFYKQAVAANSKAAGALVNLGTIYYHKRDFKTAEEYYRKAVEAEPFYPLASYNLANLFDEMGRFAEAFKYYEKALELNPYYGDAHFNIAIIYARREQGVEAIRHYRSFLECGTGQSYLETATREIKRLKEQLNSLLKVVPMPALSATPPPVSEPRVI